MPYHVDITHIENVAQKTHSGRKFLGIEKVLQPAKAFLILKPQSRIDSSVQIGI